MTEIGRNAFDSCIRLQTVIYRGAKDYQTYIAKDIDSGNGVLTRAKWRPLSPVAEVTVTDAAGADGLIDLKKTPALQLTAELSPRTELGVTWRSSDPAVASVSADGLVTFRTPGLVTVTAEAGSGASDSRDYTVYSEDMIAPERDYVLLEVRQSLKLNALQETGTLPVSVAWSFDGPTSVVILARDGTVKGVGKGTGYAVLTLTCGALKLEKRCRVDVADPLKTLPQQVSAVQLMTASVTSQVYRTEGYPTVTVLPVLEKNLKAAANSAEKRDAGVAVNAARFAVSAVNDYFRLRVKDDRTLEVIPTQAAADAAKAGSKALKASYTSALIVTVGGKEYTTAAKLKLTVKKTAPAVKAAKIAFNSYLTDERYPLKFSGAAVTDVQPAAALPAWMGFDGAALYLKSGSVPAKYPAKGTVKLLVNAEGWSVPAAVTVSYTVKKTEPKLTFSAKSVTLLQGSADTAKVTLKVTPALFADAERFPVALEKIEVLQGKKYAEPGDSTELVCSLTDGTVTLNAPSASADGKAHTYRLTLSCAGKTFTYPVKTLAAGAPQIAAKVTGGINTQLPGSACTVTLSPKNFHAGSGEQYNICGLKAYRGKTCVEEDATALFDVQFERFGNVYTFTEKMPGCLQSGLTYKAVFCLDLRGKSLFEDADLTVTLKVTVPEKAPAGSVTVSRKGALDVTRRGSALTLTAKAKNLAAPAGDNWRWSLVFFRKTGKKAVEVPADVTPFSVEQHGNVFTLTLKDSCMAATDAYSAKLRVTASDGKTYITKTAVSLPVKKGAVKVKSAPAALKLYKKDRFSRAVFTLSVADKAVSPIDHIALDAASAKKFALIDLGDNTWGLEYPGNTLPKTFRASTVRLSVYVSGCSAAAATVKLKVSYQ